MSFNSDSQKFTNQVVITDTTNAGSTSGSLVVQGGVSLGSVYINQHNSAGSVNQTSGFIDVNVAAGTPVFLHYQPDDTENGLTKNSKTRNNDIAKRVHEYFVFSLYCEI